MNSNETDGHMASDIVISASVTTHLNAHVVNNPSRGKNMKTSLILAGLLVSASALAQQPARTLVEAPSTVNATYVTASSKTALKPDEKIANLYTLNLTQPYVLQKLTQRTYWFQRQFYGTTFYVGDKGVLLFDPLEQRAPFMLAAIKEVTNLPVSAIVYSHDHGDHIGDAPAVLAALAKAGNPAPRIIASSATAEKMQRMGSKLPAPTEIVKWPNGSFKFENLVVELHGFEHAAHVDDHAAWLLVQEKVVHLPDLVNPDQPPFWEFAGSNSFAYYEQNLHAVDNLDWTYLNGGHGNVGSHADFKFYYRFLGDLKQAVGSAMASTPFDTIVDPWQVKSHTAYLPTWTDAVAKKATAALRPTYGKYYGFEYGTDSNAKMVAMYLYEYR